MDRFNDSENEKEELNEKILSAIGDIRYGSVEIFIHDSNGGIMMRRDMAVPENRRSLTNNRIKKLEKNIMRNFRLIAAIVFAWIGFGFLPPAFSAEGNVEEEGGTVEDRVNRLDQKVRIIERRFELQQEGAAEKGKGSPVTGAGRDGFSIKSADDQFQLRFRGVIQADERFLRPGADTFVLSRVRPTLEGTLYRSFDFKFVPDFGLGKTVIQDAYFIIRFHPDLNVQFGKTKAPFGLERLQADTDLRFVERALPTDLVPNRDIGVEIHSDLPNGIFNYALGIFNGVPDGGSADIDGNDNKEVVGRVFLHPFKRLGLEALQGFGIGLAASYGVARGTPAASDLPTYATVGQQVFFRYRSGTTPDATALADGVRFRTSPQAYYYWGQFGIIGEYVISSQKVRRDPAAAKLKNSAWQASASYLLTGEKNSYGSVSPIRPFDPPSGKWGAFEIAARYSVLTVDPDAFPTFSDPALSAREARAVAAGLNWYLNKTVKFMLEY